MRGGRSIDRETVGILALNTAFPRIPGDVGNATTFAFPVRYRVIEAATTDEVVAGADRARALLPHFIEGARALERDGVGAITTTCGFLAVVQDELAAAVRVPMMTSSLCLLPLVRRMLAPRQAIGVITAHAGQLSARHLEVAGARPDWRLHVRGLEACPAFADVILGGPGTSRTTLDVAAVSAAVVGVCSDLVAEHPETGALVFECTNLQPYARAVQTATGRPVFGIYQVVDLLHTAVVSPTFVGRL